MSPRLESAGERFGRVLSFRRAGDFVLRESSYAAALALPSHRHPLPYFAYVVEGAVHETGATGERTFGHGSVHFHPADEAHGGSTGTSGLTCLSIAPEGRLASRAVGRTAAGADLAPLARRCHAEFRAEDSASDLALEALALELLAAHLRSRAPRTDARSPRWIADVREHLHAHAAERVPLAALAAIAGVHPVHLVRAFRERTGVTPGAYQRRLRLDAAALALVETDAGVVDIALEAGFAGQAPFTRAFGRRFGMPPAAYRRLHRTRHA